MTFFGKFPLTTYDLEIPLGNKFAKPKTITDIFKRIALKQSLEAVGTVFGSYTIKDEDTPEIIAEKLYGSAGLHWVVLLANDIINPVFDWPLSERELVPFIAHKYQGSTFFLNSLLISGQFREGLDVTTVSSDARGTVTAFDANLSSMVVENTFGIFEEGDTLVQDIGELVPVTGELTRRVTFSKDALRHFADPQGKPLNPLPLRDGYIQGGFGFPGIADVVTYEQHERNLNESKRTIRLIHPDRLEEILRDLETIFRRNEIRRTL